MRGGRGEERGERGGDGEREGWGEERRKEGEVLKQYCDHFCGSRKGEHVYI